MVYLPFQFLSVYFAFSSTAHQGLSVTLAGLGLGRPLTLGAVCCR